MGLAGVQKGLSDCVWMGDNAVHLEARPYLLHNRIQPYEWGSRGPGAFIPRLLGIEPEPGQPYAELWIGAHPSAPSQVELCGRLVPLPELIGWEPELVLGPAVAAKFHGSLPFLLKVLSAARPLSIQVHPDRAQAQRLHARDPQHYPDPNHKPEVAIALDGLSALAGFKPFGGILGALERTPELAELAGPVLLRDLAAAATAPPSTQQALVRRLYGALVESASDGEAALLGALERLERRLRGRAHLAEEEALFLDLRREYPGPDIGLLTVFLLNLVHLKAGQGLYIGAGVPHAYLRGNIVECMAASDNVVRAGLTSKFKDAAALAEVLTYELGPAHILEAVPGPGEVVYPTPAAEFQVTRWDLLAGSERGEQDRGSVEVLLVTAGEVLLRWPAAGEVVLRHGQAVLIPACLAEYKVAARSPAQVFRVTVP